METIPVQTYINDDVIAHHLQIFPRIQFFRGCHIKIELWIEWKSFVHVEYKSNLQ